MGSVVQRKVPVGTRQFRAIHQETGQFLTLDGTNLTTNEAYAWYGSAEQFYNLKQKSSSDLLAPGIKWSLRRAWWNKPTAQHKYREVA